MPGRRTQILAIITMAIIMATLIVIAANLAGCKSLDCGCSIDPLTGEPWCGCTMEPKTETKPGI